MELEDQQNGYAIALAVKVSVKLGEIELDPLLIFRPMRFLK
jgi:hypothetical protein